MYDISKRKDLTGITIGDLIAELQRLPKEAKLICCGDDMVFLHVDTKNNIVCIDVEDLDLEYVNDPETSAEAFLEYLTPPKPAANKGNRAAPKPNRDAR